MTLNIFPCFSAFSSKDVPRTNLASGYDFMRLTPSTFQRRNGLNSLNALNGSTSLNRLPCPHHDYRSYLHQIAPSLRHTALSFAENLPFSGFATQLPK